MQATFALLANHTAHNVVRKWAWQIHQQVGTGTIISRLPPHISLKQPFTIADFAALETYMDELASTITPFSVHLTELQLQPLVFAGVEYGLLWLDVAESDELRRLHNRINQELAQHFGNTQALYDGMEYHFHMTVTMGGQPIAAYRKFYNAVAERNVDLHYTVHELAMFVYDDQPLVRKENILPTKFCRWLGS